MSLRNIVDSRTSDTSSLKSAVEQSQPLSGGLWTPENTSLPNFSLENIKQMADMSYQNLAHNILNSFDWGIPSEELKSIINSAYGKQWRHPDITPVKRLADDLASLHLGYGPTFAFKNAALEFLPRYLATITKGKIIHVFGSSSGDTVNAGHNGVIGTNNNSIFLLPQVGPSEVQGTLATNGIVGNKNALTILADAPFDPLQDSVKRVNSPEFAEFKAEHNITSFNSINIARILAQVVYYFRAYTQLVKQGRITAGDEVNFSVPSGNFGDALAGLYAREMGLPIKRINVATNENDILHKFFQTGRYEPPKRGGKDYVQVTNAPSQDIAKSSNFERALFWACQDQEKIKKRYSDLAKNGFFEVDAETFAKLKGVFTSSTSTDSERLNAIKTMGGIYNHGIDTHTATGVAPILSGEFGDDVPTIFLETSHIAQFKTELQAKGILVPGMDEFDDVINRIKANKPIEGKHYLRTSGDFEDIFKAVKQAIQILASRN